MATRGPSSSLHRKRRDKFLRAVLAGATFEKKGAFEDHGLVPMRTRSGWVDQWFIDLPHYRISAFGYTSGPFRWRHQAVDQAMKMMELE